MEMGRASLPAPSLYPRSYRTSTPPLLGGDRRRAGRLTSVVVGDQVGDGVRTRDAVGRGDVRVIRGLAVAEAPEVADDRAVRVEGRGLEEDRGVDLDRAGRRRAARRLPGRLDGEVALGQNVARDLWEQPRLRRAQLDGHRTVERGGGVGADRPGAHAHGLVRGGVGARGRLIHDRGHALRVGPDLQPGPDPDAGHGGAQLPDVREVAAGVGDREEDVPARDRLAVLVADGGRDQRRAEAVGHDHVGAGDEGDRGALLRRPYQLGNVDAVEAAAGVGDQQHDARRRLEPGAAPGPAIFPRHCLPRSVIALANLMGYYWVVGHVSRLSAKFAASICSRAVTVFVVWSVVVRAQSVTSANMVSTGG